MTHILALMKEINTTSNASSALCRAAVTCVFCCVWKFCIIIASVACGICYDRKSCILIGRVAFFSKRWQHFCCQVHSDWLSGLGEEGDHSCVNFGADSKSGWPHSSQNEIPCVFPEFFLCYKNFLCVIFMQKLAISSINKGHITTALLHTEAYKLIFKV